MNSTLNFARCAFLLSLLVLLSGCGGINVGKSVSPLDFLLPGAGSFLKADPAQPGLNQPTPTEKPVPQLT